MAIREAAADNRIPVREVHFAQERHFPGGHLGTVIEAKDLHPSNRHYEIDYLPKLHGYEIRFVAATGREQDSIQFFADQTGTFFIPKK